MRKKTSRNTTSGSRVKKLCYEVRDPRCETQVRLVTVGDRCIDPRDFAGAHKGRPYCEKTNLPTFQPLNLQPVFRIPTLAIPHLALVSGFLLIDVNIPLRKRNANPLVVKALLDRFGYLGFH